MTRVPELERIRREIEATATGPATEALPRFLAAQRRTLERVEAANGLDLSRTRVVSPLARWIRMNLLAFFLVYVGHERRHLWQAADVRRRVLETNATTGAPADAPERPA